MDPVSVNACGLEVVTDNLAAALDLLSYVYNLIDFPTLSANLMAELGRGEDVMHLINACARSAA